MRLMEQFGVNMIERAGSAAPVIGRENEIGEIIEILCRKHKNNPALVGEPGVGKTAIVEGLAKRMAAKQVPTQLRGKQLYSLELPALVAGTKYRGEFEERMRELLSEITRAGNMIVFIDEMHMLVGAGAAEGAIDAANILKPALSRGQLQIIGATTADEYRKYIEKDAALERRFRRIRVDEPTPEQTGQILRGLRPELERHHGLRISDAAIDAAVRLSRRYLPEYYFPDKALDLLDEGAAHACMGDRRSVHQRALDGELKEAIGREDFAKALAIQSKVREICRRESSPNCVGTEAVAHALSRRTGIPVQELTSRERERLLTLEQTLGETVIGQDAALKTVADAVRRGRMALEGQNRPAAAIMLTGPTGTGKTLLCKTLARAVYGSETAMIRLDMTEYAEMHSASRLLGAPPGYVGYDEGGTLTEKVRRNPYSLVLFDEIDKASRGVTGVLLQLMDDGRLTDSAGRTVDFRNTLVLMTANAGAEEFSAPGLGFAPSAMEDRIGERLKRQFSPEFLGRFDAVAVFAPLNEAALIRVAGLQLDSLKTQMKRRGVSLSWTPEVCTYLVKRAGHGGARGIRNALVREIISPVARRLLQEERRFFLSVVDNQLVMLSENAPVL